VNLCEVADGRHARVVSLASVGAERRRLTELGVRHGAVVQVVRRAPLQGPIAIRVGGGLLALRPENARRVLVEEIPEAHRDG
jgi:ferrous iron transport protein A